MADATTAAAPPTRPQLPDEGEYNKALAKAESEHKELMEKLKAVKAKIDLAAPKKDSDNPSPQQKRRAELIAQANEIRQKQAGGKNARTSKMEQIKRLDEQVRSRIAEQKTARAKVPYKSAEEVDAQITRLDSQVNSGTMKLVDEKKALADISQLRKLRKSFGQFDDSQRAIDDLRAKIKELRDSMEDPEQKALSERYSKIQSELDAIKAEADEAYKGLSTLRDERTRLQAEQQEKYGTLKKVKDDYWAAKKAAQKWERDQRDKARERQRAERERIDKERKKATAERLLADARDPAYLEEIRRANSLLQFLDPSHTAEKAPLLASSGMTAQASRTVDGAGIKGTKLVSKKDREDEYLPAAKKGKKARKPTAAAAESGPAAKGFSCPPSVLEDCAFMGIDPPMAQADVAAVIEKVKAKLEHWKSDQAAQTQRNVDKAMKEIAKLEAEEAAAAAAAESGAATSNGVNGDKPVADVAKDLKETSLDEKKEVKA